MNGWDDGRGVVDTCYGIETTAARGGTPLLALCAGGTPGGHGGRGATSAATTTVSATFDSEGT